jgi:hypothetical protein
MNTASRRWTYDLIGACTGIAGVVLLFATVAAAGSLGYSVGAVLGGGFAFGLLACGVKEAIARRSRRFVDERRAAALPSDAAPSIAATPLFTNATAVRFGAVRQPGVAAVTSLTEIQALRRRAARRRERQGATRAGA